MAAEAWWRQAAEAAAALRGSLVLGQERDSVHLHLALSLLRVICASKGAGTDLFLSQASSYSR